MCRHENEGYLSTDADQEQNSYASVTRPKQVEAEFSETYSRPAGEQKSDQNSEESHGEGCPLVITETTFTNSQNTAYRNFNNNVSNNRGRGNYRGGYYNGSGSNPRNYDYNGNYGPRNFREPNPDADESHHDPGLYGGKKPIGQNWKKFRKFNTSNVGTREESMMDAFLDEPSPRESHSHRSGSGGFGRHNFSPRNLIEIQTTPQPNNGDEEFPPLGTEATRQTTTSPVLNNSSFHD